VQDRASSARDSIAENAAGPGCWQCPEGEENLGGFSVPPDEIVGKSALISGGSGMGKTMLAAHLILQIRKYDRKRTLVAFDSENEYGRIMANYLAPDDLIGMNYADYWKSLYQPVETHGGEWIYRLSAGFERNLYLGDSGKLIFLEESMKLIRKKNTLSRGGLPIYGELVRQIEEMQATGKMHQYKIALLSGLKGLAGPFGAVYNHRLGFTWEDFRGKVVVINLFGMDPLARTIFISIEMSELYMLAASDPDFRVTAVFDEFYRFASAGRKDGNGVSSAGEVAKTGRKRQFQIIGIEQNVSLAEPAILGNMDVFAAFRPRDPKDRHIRAVVLNPFLKQKEIFERWGLGVGSGKKVWDELVGLGLCEEKTANPGGAGGQFKSLWPMEKGLAFARLGGRFQRPRGKGDWEHVCYQHLVARRLMGTGADAAVEGEISGKSVDIKVIRDGRVEAWEIEMKVTAQTMKNVVDDLERGAASVTVLVKRKAQMEKAREMLRQHEADIGRAVFGSRVKVEYLRDYI